MSRSEYVFESGNKGDVTVNVTGRYDDGSVDLTVGFDGDHKEWTDLDGGNVDEVFDWLREKGVTFASPRSLWFNLHYVEQIMVDRDLTEEQLLDRCAALSEADLEEFLDLYGWRE